MQCEQCFNDVDEKEIDVIYLDGKPYESCIECRLKCLDSYADSENELNFEE